MDADVLLILSSTDGVALAAFQRRAWERGAELLLRFLSRNAVTFIKCIVLTACYTETWAVDFSSANYYWQNYLFDAQIYGKNISATENTLSHKIENATLYAKVFSYNNNAYNEVDLGLGTEILIAKFTLDTGFWYYNYFVKGGNYMEPYLTIDYDWIVKPTLNIGYIGYNGNFRAVFSLEYSFEPVNNLTFTLKPQIGTANYEYRYGYFGAILSADYQINTVLSIFSAFEIDKTIGNSPAVVNSLSAGLTIDF